VLGLQRVRCLTNAVHAPFARILLPGIGCVGMGMAICTWIVGKSVDCVSTVSERIADLVSTRRQHLYMPVQVV
jgi:hypothetical protein